MAEIKAPNSRRNLDEAIKRAHGEDYLRARTAMANAIVGQLLPEGVVKGGSALKLRFGNAATRFTTDLDAARVHDIEAFVENLEDRLSEGWCGFAGHVVPRSPAHPRDVPEQYVMQPFDVKLSYNGKSWLTVPLEVGHDEIGDADEVEYGLAEDVAALFEAVGLPAPGPSPLMPLHHQIAQKLHAVSAPGGDRAHDLIDLQVICSMGDVDFKRTRETCVRLFAYRRQQAWPPVIEADGRWAGLYDAQAEGLDVLGTVDEAVDWANELIAAIDSAR